MQFTLALVSIVLNAVVAIASPAPAPSPAPFKRDGPSERKAQDGPDTAIFFACEHVSFSGNCNYWRGGLNKCNNLDTYWNDIMSSGQPLSEGVVCDVFQHIDCSGRKLTLSGPVDDFEANNFNDIASSFRCHF